MTEVNLILSSNSIYRSLFKNLNSNRQWIYLDNKNLFTIGYLREKKIKKIFIPHWSFIIPKEIYQNFECILFHMTDLPFGRGGSPLQNLIKFWIFDSEY